MKTKLTTTLAKTLEASACDSGYRKLVKHLGGVTEYGADTEINLLTILEANGVLDMIWCLRCTMQDSKRISAQLAIEFAAYALPIFEARYPSDKRPRAAIQAVRSFLDGAIEPDEFIKARSASYAAAANAAANAADNDAAAYAVVYAAAAAFYATDTVLTPAAEAAAAEAGADGHDVAAANAAATAGAVAVEAYAYYSAAYAAISAAAATSSADGTKSARQKARERQADIILGVLGS